MLLLIILFIISIEATTNIVSKSEFFKPLRKYLFNHSNYRAVRFIHDLIDCPYCTSVWISLFYVCAALLLMNTHGFIALETLMIVVSFHRLSNILHYVIDRLDRSNGYELPTETEDEK